MLCDPSCTPGPNDSPHHSWTKKREQVTGLARIDRRTFHVLFAAAGRSFEWRRKLNHEAAFQAVMDRGIALRAADIGGINGKGPKPERTWRGPRRSSRHKL